jgi:hypothetical protein
MYDDGASHGIPYIGQLYQVNREGLRKLGATEQIPYTRQNGAGVESAVSGFPVLLRSV